MAKILDETDFDRLRLVQVLVGCGVYLGACGPVIQMRK